MVKLTLNMVDRTDGIDTHLVYWVVFPRAMRNRKITRKIAESGYDVERQRCEHEYDCCGKLYGSGLSITRKGTRALATITVIRNV